MSSAYAGILGFLAFAATVARGVIDGQDASSVLQRALLALVAFAVIGAIAGRIGDTVVAESVERNLRTEIEAYRQEATSQNSSGRTE